MLPIKDILAIDSPISSSTHSSHRFSPSTSTSTLFEDRPHKRQKTMEEHKAQAGQDVEMLDISGTKTAAVNGSQYTFGQQPASSISPQRQEMQHPGLLVPPAQPPKTYATSSTATTTGTGLAFQVLNVLMNSSFI
jgi:hypothetical protein